MRQINYQKGITPYFALAIVGILALGGIVYAVLTQTKNVKPEEGKVEDKILEEYLEKQAENYKPLIPIDQDIPINPETAAAVNEKLENTTMGQGTEFLADSVERSPIRIESSEEIGARIDVLDGLIEISIKNAEKDSTIFTIYNLEPNKTYYKYVDTLSHGEEIQADGQGIIRFEQDTSRRHLVMIMDNPSTYVIEDTPTGGDCGSIGDWDNLSKTCLLTKNVDDTIEIASDGITLDGNDFSVTNPMDKDYGIFIGVRSDVVIKNLFVGDYQRGIKLFGSTNVRVENVFLRDNSRAIDLEGSGNNVIVRNTVQQSSSTNTRQGIFLNMSDGNIIVSNSVIDSRRGYGFIDSADNGFADNTATNNFNALFTVNGQGVIERNNFIDNDQDVDLTNAENFIFYDNFNERGNYWSKFDDESEGCVDTNADKKCDSPYDFLDKTDLFPWICPEAWSKDCPVEPGPGGEVQSLIKPVDISDGRVRCFLPSYMTSDKWKHNGIDIIGPQPGIIAGKNVLAAASGMVHFASPPFSEKVGNWVWIEHGRISKLDGTIEEEISTRYLHLSTVVVNDNEVVDQAQKIGTVGDTGSLAEGAHLHFDIQRGLIPSDFDARKTEDLNPHFFIDYPAEENTTMCLINESPVDVVLVDPDGLKLNSSINEIGPNAEYTLIFYPPDLTEIEDDEYEIYRVENRKMGEYKIIIIPKPGADPNEIYTLTIFVGEIPIVLAENVSVSNIPPNPYIIKSTLDGLELISDGVEPEGEVKGVSKTTICHIPPGNPKKAHAITVGEPAVKAHLAHGDSLGECEDN